VLVVAARDVNRAKRERESGCYCKLGGALYGDSAAFYRRYCHGVVALL